MAEDCATLNGLDGSLADGGTGRNELDAPEGSSTRDEGVSRYDEAGRDGASQVRAVGANDIEIRLGTEVDNDHRSHVALSCSYGVHDAVRPDLTRVVDEYRHTRLGTWFDNDDTAAPHPVSETAKSRRNGGHHG